MSEKEYKNGYEKYSEWFDVIEGMCDEKNFVESEANYFDGPYEHFKLDNGLEFFKLKDETRIAKGRAEIGRLKAKEEDGEVKHIYIEIGKIKIVYCSEDTSYSYLTEDGKHELAVLPTNDKNEGEINKIEGDNIGSIDQLLITAIDNAEDDRIKETYENILGLCNSISEVVSKEKDKISQKIQEQPTTPDLENLSQEELEEILRKTQAQNSAKKEDLESIRRKELIAQIQAAQQEGEELDVQLREARGKTQGDR